EDPSDLPGMAQDAADDPWLLGGRDSDVDDFDPGVVEHLLQRVEDLVDPAQRGDLAGQRARPRGQPQDAKASVPVGHEMTVADDEAGTHDADANVQMLRRYRQVAQIPGAGGGHGGSPRPMVWIRLSSSLF